jgi:hypothetical protein
MLGQYVARKKAPDMVAAKAVALFNQDDFQFGPHFRKGKRDEPARKPAADNGQIAFDIFACHHAALAQPFYKGKASAKVMHSFMHGDWTADRRRHNFSIC